MQSLELNGPKIKCISIRRITMPLIVPYHLSYRTFQSFEPIFIQCYGANGKIGWADGHISPGSSTETRLGGWTFCQNMAPGLIGLEAGQALRTVQAKLDESKVIATAMSAALEMLLESPVLDVSKEVNFPLVTPVNGFAADEIEVEVEKKLDAGFSCFKIKVGKEVDSDLNRLWVIQNIVKGRASLRIDANRAYSLEQGCHFASSLNPEAVELFEQPCSAEDWEANAEVAAVSRVPLMLDESICSMSDIRRAATIDGIGYCKLKLKRFGSLAGLKAGLALVSESGMEPVLGDGLGSEITCWMEACVARNIITSAGEFNGFLKPRGRLFSNPLQFENGSLIIEAGYVPQINQKTLDEVTLEQIDFSGKQKN